jgi:protoporphyrinogen oxidase/glycosyltransferase involved in cell wall biosynthesis
MPTILVFSHLRWDFVFQRPQHLLSRLAENYKICFFEEPMYRPGPSALECSNPLPNVTVCRPHTPVEMPGFHDDHLPYLKKMVRELERDGEETIVWFYTPMALPLLQELHPRLVVYDCMDELSAFRNPPKQLLQRESSLLKRADIVFTGGPSLYNAKKDRHPNVHCFPSSVDVKHFAQALDRANAHPAHRDIPGPRLGFYGVIDERFDPTLIEKLADAHPQWQIVLVGPVVKIDPDSLPRRDNIHYLGQQPYEALPQLLAGWDVCMMPFALNESTKFISPTKSLEYMAAELPIVSTPIKDVVDLHSDVVAIAHTPEEFIAGCEAALLASPEERERMVQTMRDKLTRTSWDSTATSMHQLMSDMAQAARDSAAAIAAASTPVEAGMLQNVNQLAKLPAKNYGTIVIGAGPTGLSTAYHLDKDTLLLERGDAVGGWCRSIQDHGFTFDHAGHILFSSDPYVLEMVDTLLGDNLHWQNREAWIYSHGVHTRYPFQSALHGLPPKVIAECITGAIEARYGSTRQPDTSSSAANCTTASGDAGDCINDAATAAAAATAPAVAAQKAAAVALQNAAPRNFEEFIHRVWGAGIARHFALPYNRKLWTVPLAEMETSWLGGRVPLPDLHEIIEGALAPAARPVGPDARFGYPLTGGFEALMKGFLPHIKGTVETNARVVEVIPQQKIVALSDGRRFQYEQLVSTMPLPELVKVVDGHAPREVHAAAQGLRHISVCCVNLGVAREAITDKHWIYYPGDEVFHRVFVQGNASPHCNAPGGFALTCEISYSEHKPLPARGEELVARCMADLVKVGLLKPEDTLMTSNIVDMPYAYVLYDHERAKNVETIRQWMAQHDIVLAGRYSEWEYYNADHAFLAGRKAAQEVEALQPKKRVLGASD